MSTPVTPSGEPDPIFAAIERHRAAVGGYLAAYDRLGVLQEMIPEARRRWQIFHERPDHCADAPEWIEANTAFLAATEQLNKAYEIVLSTPPTTIAGAADLLDYVSWYECQRVPGGPIHENVFRRVGAMVAATLPRRVTGEPDPIFAVIERHRAALRSWPAAIDRRERLRRMIPEARRRWESGEMPDHCTDAPEWIEATNALIDADEELDKALEAVLSTPPTTIAGVADLLDYVSREEWEVTGVDNTDEWCETILENALERAVVGGVGKAAANFLPMIAATLRSLTAESS